MDIVFDELFHSPGGRVRAFAQMQLHLYRQDVRLQDYFLALQRDPLSNARADSRRPHTPGPLLTGALRGVDQVSRFCRRRKIKVDVLFCPAPYFSRETESRFFVRTLLALAETDAKILCLLPACAPCRAEADAQLASLGRTGQVTFIDPEIPLNQMEGCTRPKIARMRARSAFRQTIQILEPLGLVPGVEVEAGYEHLAYYIEAWERLAPSVEFEAVVARCHWHALCSPVCRTAIQRGKPVITFQQGVISHSLDVPVTATEFVAFGPSSASFLPRVNRAFFRAAKIPESPVSYLNGGCLYDTIIALPDQFDRQTLLMVDVPTDGSQSKFYGLEGQCQALLDLAERLLTADLALRRLIIRPHPYWSDLDFQACQRIVRGHSSRCELSHPAWSLEDDLRRSSAVVGIFSGVLTVASACGLPTVFLQTERGFATGDLACFSPRQTLLPEAAFKEIGELLTDRKAYAEARTEALRNGREYYANGANLDLNAKFFERLLSADAETRPERSGGAE
jgi:hypothetical protein